MTKWVKTDNRTARTVWYFTVMQPLKPQKDNIYAALQYYDIQNPRRYLVSYYDIDISIYCPALLGSCWDFALSILSLKIKTTECPQI